MDPAALSEQPEGAENGGAGSVVCSTPNESKAHRSAGLNPEKVTLRYLISEMGEGIALPSSVRFKGRWVRWMKPAGCNPAMTNLPTFCVCSMDAKGFSSSPMGMPSQINAAGDSVSADLTLGAPTTVPARREEFGG